MKVIKPGNGKQTYTRQVMCTGKGNPNTDGCGAVLEVTREDLRFYNGQRRYIARPDAVVVRCPCCGGITDLEEYDWPSDYHTLEEFTTRWRDGL